MSSSSTCLFLPTILSQFRLCIDIINFNTKNTSVFLLVSVDLFVIVAFYLQKLCKYIESGHFLSTLRVFTLFVNYVSKDLECPVRLQFIPICLLFATLFL